MDDINPNGNNPFDEQNMQEDKSQNTYDPYNQPAQNYDPYNQPVNPYAQQNTQQGADQYGPASQNTNPYAQQGQYSQPYSRPYDQGQQGQYMQDVSSPYNQQNTYNRQNIPQSGYVQSPYGTQYRPYMPAQNMSTGMAVASLVLGICSIVLGLFMFAFPPLFLLPIIGIILGIVFKCKHLPVGKGMSTAGIITSVFGLIIPLALLIIIMVMLITNGAEIMEFMKQYSPEDYEELYELYGEQFPEWFEGAMRFFGLM